jgi:hypothetical protein
MRRIAIVSLAAVAMLTVAAPASGAPPLIVQTSVSPPWLYFADTVTAQVDVLFDQSNVDASSIRIDPSFGMWQQVAPVRSSSTHSGTVTRKTMWFTISCLTFQCVPKTTTAQPFVLPPVIVTGRNLDGSSLKISKTWHVLYVAGRFPPTTSTDVVPTFRLQSQIPAPTYRLNPTMLAFVLDAIGAIIVVLALAIGVRTVARGRLTRHHVVDHRPPLVRALALVRAAQTRDPDDRRRAVGLLARTLPQQEDSLKGVASEIAWSMPEPSVDRVEELARTVEAELKEPS